jgi:hypothetical protein
LSDFTNVTDFDADFPSIWSALTMVNNQVPGQKVEPGPCLSRRAI